MYGLMYN